MESYTTNDRTAPAARAPDFLTVEEAAAVLRIGRTAAYEATRRWRATGGAEGIAVVKVGGTLRVPRRTIEALAGGPVEVPAPGSEIGPAQAVMPSRLPTARRDPTPPVRRRGQAHDGRQSAQSSLPFTA